MANLTTNDRDNMRRTVIVEYCLYEPQRPRPG